MYIGKTDVFDFLYIYNNMYPVAATFGRRDFQRSAHCQLRQIYTLAHTHAYRKLWFRTREYPPF